MLASDIKHNESIFKRIFHDSSDIVFASVRAAGREQWLVIFLASLVDEQLIDQHILKPLIASGNLPRRGERAVRGERVVRGEG